VEAYFAGKVSSYSSHSICLPLLERREAMATATATAFKSSPNQARRIGEPWARQGAFLSHVDWWAARVTLVKNYMYGNVILK
jgi:hypothetical protein